MWQQIIVELLKYYGRQAIILMFGIVLSITEHWFQSVYASNLTEIFKEVVKNLKISLPNIRLIWKILYRDWSQSRV
jgi:hypothetical protein